MKTLKEFVMLLQRIKAKLEEVPDTEELRAGLDDAISQMQPLMYYRSEGE